MPHKRVHERVPFAILVQYRFGPDDDFTCEYAEDLSAGGLFIRTHEVRSTGTMVYVQFVLKNGSRLIEGLGRVANVGAPERPGLGIEFVSIDDESKAMLDAIVRPSQLPTAAAN